MVELKSIWVTCLSNWANCWVWWLDIATLILTIGTLYLAYKAIRTAKEIQDNQFLFELTKDKIATRDILFNAYIRDNSNEVIKERVTEIISTSMIHLKRMKIDPLDVYDEWLHDIIKEIQKRSS